MPAKDPFEQLMPTIFQIGRERRAQRRKEKQAQQVSDVVKRLIHGDVKGEERAGLYAQAARFGVALPSQYAYDLADTKDLDWDQELKDAYNARLLTYTQATAAHSKANNNKTPSTEEVQELWNQSPELQQQFPGAGEITGATQLHTFFQFKEYAGTIAANKTFGMGVEAGQTAKEHNLQIVSEILGPGVNIREDVLPYPNLVAQLKVAGIGYNNLLEMAGYNVEIVARATRSITEEARRASSLLEFKYDETLSKWAQGQDIDAASQSTLDRLMDKDTRKPKDELVHKEADRLEGLAWERAGYTPKEVKGIPKHIQPILLKLKSIGVTTKEQAEAWKEQALREALQPMTRWKTNTEWLSSFNEVLEYLD